MESLNVSRSSSRITLETITRETNPYSHLLDNNEENRKQRHGSTCSNVPPIPIHLAMNSNKPETIIRYNEDFNNSARSHETLNPENELNEVTKSVMNTIQETIDFIHKNPTKDYIESSQVVETENDKQRNGSLCSNVPPIPIHLAMNPTKPPDTIIHHNAGFDYNSARSQTETLNPENELNEVTKRLMSTIQETVDFIHKNPTSKDNHEFQYFESSKATYGNREMIMEGTSSDFETFQTYSATPPYATVIPRPHEWKQDSEPPSLKSANIHYPPPILESYQLNNHTRQTHIPELFTFPNTNPNFDYSLTSIPRPHVPNLNDQHFTPPQPPQPPHSHLDSYPYDPIPYFNAPTPIHHQQEYNQNNHNIYNDPKYITAQPNSFHNNTNHEQYTYPVEGRITPSQIPPASINPNYINTNPVNSHTHNECLACKLGNKLTSSAVVDNNIPPHNTNQPNTPLSTNNSNYPQDVGTNNMNSQHEPPPAPNPNDNYESDPHSNLDIKHTIPQHQKPNDGARREFVRDIPNETPQYIAAEDNISPWNEERQNGVRSYPLPPANYENYENPYGRSRIRPRAIRRSASEGPIRSRTPSGNMTRKPMKGSWCYRDENGTQIFVQDLQLNIEGASNRAVVMVPKTKQHPKIIHRDACEAARDRVVSRKPPPQHQNVDNYQPQFWASAVIRKPKGPLLDPSSKLNATPAYNNLLQAPQPKMLEHRFPPAVLNREDIYSDLDHEEHQNRREGSTYEQKKGIPNRTKQSDLDHKRLQMHRALQYLNEQHMIQNQNDTPKKPRSKNAFRELLNNTNEISSNGTTEFISHLAPVPYSPKKSYVQYTDPNSKLGSLSCSQEMASLKEQEVSLWNQLAQRRV